MYNLWKLGQALQEVYRAMVFACREKTSKIKVQLWLKMANVVSDSKKVFFKNAISKRRSRKNTGPILIEDGLLSNKDEEESEAFNAFFCFSLKILGDLWLPSPLSWRTMSMGTVTFHLWTLKL